VSSLIQRITQEGQDEQAISLMFSEKQMKNEPSSDTNPVFELEEKEQETHLLMND
jgi:hypothetical protein